MFDFYPTCLEKTKHVGIFTPGCFFPHMFGFWHICMGKGTHVWKKPHNYMIANVWHFPHMCGKSHRPAYFPLSYRWRRNICAIRFVKKYLHISCQGNIHKLPGNSDVHLARESNGTLLLVSKLISSGLGAAPPTWVHVVTMWIPFLFTLLLWILLFSSNHWFIWKFFKKPLFFQLLYLY